METEVETRCLTFVLESWGVSLTCMFAAVELNKEVQLSLKRVLMQQVFCAASALAFDLRAPVHTCT
jgi:hypothetical protein